ncbi:hypothetical protein, conserved [Trypanosoma brucei gambiense DAL972]|uniref:tRNA 4-demethylwyosine synthase (AdoMet-dependent) n=1 Tax=Trypanosoma brucei gambiense (strain MHOM/CI/86/DAL972) TaxID=679716 RepID=C9ZU99_TRYB9|nr:hypothetical protein, conserved [Trypanosoma brucei gambiense DAL972]CBH12986.1 hypothetical protein, conserved [Trypanosoma brucei gambiense DAL972]|eukprot:XP_011775264.1 hypothetical protein, conserved [Trypanosoma brucei gambiense DAL972]
MELLSVTPGDLLVGCWVLTFVGIIFFRWFMHRRRSVEDQPPEAAQTTAGAQIHNGKSIIPNRRDAGEGSSCRCCSSNDDVITSENVETCGKQQKRKKILVAYATQSNTSYKLSNKLISMLNLALHENSSAYGTCGGSLVLDAASGVSCCCSRDPKAGVAPEIKLLQLKEEATQCSTEHLLESGAYGLVVFFVSTYTGGTAPEPSHSFASMLKDAYLDFRVPRDVFAGVNFAIFGLGDIAYGPEKFNRFAKDLYTWCKGLGGKFVIPPVYASESNTTTLFHVFSTALVKWIGRAAFTADGVTVMKKKSMNGAQSLNRRLNNKNNEEEEQSVGGECVKDDEAVASGSGNHNSQNGDPSEGCGSDDGDSDSENSDNNDDKNNNNNNSDDGDAEDVEDIVGEGDDYFSSTTNGEPPELLYPRLRENLQRQGYHLVGSHSGVKLCRWTKAMLRGRGGCYKHTFYNIASYQCMEMTPSLACANKCVFCWRHHTNPVGRSFRWKVDPPRELIEGGLAGHRRMVKQMRGVPGVTPQRLEEALNVRHCALSLVGEPIMYPEINTFVDLLHEQNISSFMVTNAQFPEQLRDLKPVTQLYLSIDAPTPEELQRVDRPLFEDYWERCLACVRELRRKPQRTVFRLTLVNKYNTENVSAYADLVRLGWPDFIEVKGVTYCGTSSTSTLTMKDNVPRHTEVVEFCEALCQQLATSNEPKEKRMWLGRDIVEEQQGAVAAAESGAETHVEGGMTTSSLCGPYRIACEHEHSCCVLISLRRFFIDGVWHTWIDYDKFSELARSGRRDFTAAEYAAPTPPWAVFQSEERGFDPTQVRVIRKSGKSEVITSGC